MRLRSARIQNFRCLQDATVRFDDVTTLIGPNGVGKSSILRALDWFFNGGSVQPITEEDVFRHDADERTVSVTVEFDDLSDADRAELGRYASPGVDTVSIVKTWHQGVEKLVGRALAWPPLSPVRSEPTATRRKDTYSKVLSGYSDLDLPAWTNNDDTLEALDEWESAHPGLLEPVDIESSTHFFGFAGQAKMSGRFDFVFVSADLRAGEESQDSRGAIIGRILAQAVDRSVVNEALDNLVEQFSEDQRELVDRHLGKQLASLSQDLTAEVAELVAGRDLSVRPAHREMSAQVPGFEVAVQDGTVDTSVERQGHGFQRALLIAALRLLATRGAAQGGETVLCLAIEEPELYQHPLQARLFASVLRSLAEDRDNGMQVAYATHSPYFVEPRSFHQLRRVSRSTVDAEAGHDVEVTAPTLEQIIERMNGFMTAGGVRRQISGACMGSLAESFFADVVLLVEGTTDRAILAGIADRESFGLLLRGIFICEAGGKNALLLAHAILDSLGIPSYVLADNDSHRRDELDAAVAAGDLERSEALGPTVDNIMLENRMLLRFFGVDEEDWPTGSVDPQLRFVDGGLEQAIERTWPSWVEKRDELISSGDGFSGKNAATYGDAATQCDGAVPDEFIELINQVQALKVGQPR